MRCGVVAVGLMLAGPAWAQHEGHEAGHHGHRMTGPLGAPWARQAGGTAWQPDASPVYAWHGMQGDWHLMGEATLFGQYVDEGGLRGDEDFGAQGMVMGMAGYPLLGGEAELRVMLSPDPLTLGECGYPDALQTGERCDESGTLHDRQHPHDLFMELAASWQGELTGDLALQVYGGVAGEPALGPVSFPHRLSAQLNPIAPIGHHWLDASHVTFGLATVGLSGRWWKVEGSAFNGRDPDEERFDLDLDVPDSFSGRAWLLPIDELAFQVSVGRLNDHATHEPDETGAHTDHTTESAPEPIDVTRYTASGTWHHPYAGGYWNLTAAWGRNDGHPGAEATDAFLVEGTVNDGETHVVFARAELAEKLGSELVTEKPLTVYRVAKTQVGYVRQFAAGETLLGLGFSTWAARVTEGLIPLYGEDSPLGLSVFATLRPAALSL